MPTTVGRLALRVPTSGDNPDIPADFLRLATDLSTVALDDQGTLAARPVSTVGAPSNKPGRYWYVTGDGDATQNGRLWRDTGAGWVEVMMNSRPVLTALPGSPVTGNEILFQTAAMVTAGVGPWTLRYDSTLSGTSKWKVLAGEQLADEITAIESTSSAVFVDLTTIGPSITVPWPGIYDIAVGGHIGNNVAGNDAIMGVRLGPAPVQADVDTVQTFASAGGKVSVYAHFKGRTLGPLFVVKIQYRAGGAGTAIFGQRTLHLTPRRIG